MNKTITEIMEEEGISIEENPFELEVPEEVKMHEIE